MDGAQLRELLAVVPSHLEGDRAEEYVRWLADSPIFRDRIERRLSREEFARETVVSWSEADILTFERGRIRAPQALIEHIGKRRGMSRKASMEEYLLWFNRRPGHEKKQKPYDVRHWRQHNPLRARRRALQVTRTGFAKSIGSHWRSIERWERGAHIPSLKKIWDASAALGCRPGTLVEEYLLWLKACPENAKEGAECPSPQSS